MMTNPITPPPELFTEWLSEALLQHDAKSGTVAAMVTDKAAQWGADQELEACCEWLGRNYNYPQVNHPLRTARRPKPPSLKEQALHELADVYDRDKIDDSTYDTIRRALEALDD